MTGEQPTCPYCGRVMTQREKSEQGACNECYEPNPASDFSLALDITTRRSFTGAERDATRARAKS